MCVITQQNYQQVKSRLFAELAQCKYLNRKTTT